ncbi:hypothetical protein BT93_L1480 [Corymbia citriodora subsp. variegata]|uniref:B3 domain-containing protein n=1 Tax=Corymbia citriodora subsp. variegata TaxID=360336 RepID=A0A8T0CMH3_CORYI|nr:hypothetical protein BT93_L1480 [Corymbia citriodora subsp. variegata]
MGEREKKADWSSFHVLANTSELVREGLLSVSPAAQTRPTKLPKVFWDEILKMYGQGVRLVLEKRLCATDMNPSKGRLSIPKQQRKAKFLTDEEDRALDNKAMTVSLIEPGPVLQVRHGLKLQKDYKREDYFSYVLTKEWNAVTHSNARNGLEEGCLIQLWAFRVNGDLHFCLVN